MHFIEKFPDLLTGSPSDPTELDELTYYIVNVLIHT